MVKSMTLYTKTGDVIAKFHNNTATYVIGCVISNTKTETLGKLKIHRFDDDMILTIRNPATNEGDIQIQMTKDNFFTIDEEE